jgi:hypothetical protein
MLPAAGSGIAAAGTDVRSSYVCGSNKEQAGSLSTEITGPDYGKKWEMRGKD